ncbi:uncharacterized protein G2W53_020866 [Senna tora]|uniref:Uncharacterized protein n=1 Tax=Senna tora TaxID=362788 RepID=A0A834SN67_9FABA|nr:uncharacterized protein G2W53_044745 [Senna tora]KAF7822722.1 uncharacterized protein G2W53_020866 [Senna tora]
MKKKFEKPFLRLNFRRPHACVHPFKLTGMKKVTVGMKKLLNEEGEDWFRDEDGFR